MYMYECVCIYIYIYTHTYVYLLLRRESRGQAGQASERGRAAAPKPSTGRNRFGSIRFGKLDSFLSGEGCCGVGHDPAPGAQGAPAGTRAENE